MTSKGFICRKVAVGDCTMTITDKAMTIPYPLANMSKYMYQGGLLSRENTRWTQGMAALIIMVMHFVMKTDDYPRILNVLGAVGVAAFLFISGFGINESWKSNGLRGFWRKRVLRVFVPCWIVFLFKLPFGSDFDIARLLKSLTFFDSELWFIDYIIRWYMAYWLCRRFAFRHTTLMLMIAGIGSIFCEQLCSEQSFSFFAGYLASEYRDKVYSWNKKEVSRITLLATAWGLIFYTVKALPPVRAFIGTLPFNILQLNIMLPLAISIITLPYLLPQVKRIQPINWCGKISYEIYLVHYNFMPYITGMASVVAYSAVSLAIAAVFNKVNLLLRERGKLLTAIAIILFVSVNYMLMTKYSMRVTQHFGYVTITYALLLSGVCLLLYRNTATATRTKMLFFVLSLVLALSMLVVQYHFDPMQIRVDRWSAIANPLTALFNGEYPYLAKTHLDGYASPFPVWMVFHIPFWALGNVGLSSIVAAIIFLFSIKSLGGYGAALKATVLLAVSICM